MIDRRLFPSAVGAEDLALSWHFKCVKSTRAIPVTSPLFEDALVLVSLDPRIRAIEPIPRILPDTGVVLVCDDGKFMLRVEPDRPSGRAINLSGSITPLILPEIVMTENYLRTEPRCSNNRVVWSNRHQRVSAGLRFQIMQILVERGPMTLGDLMSRVRILGNSANSIFALACSNVRELELTEAPIGTSTIVKHVP